MISFDTLFDVGNTTMLVYFVLLDIVYALLALIGWRAVREYVRRRPLRDYDFVSRSPLSPPVTMLVPAHNEAASITASVRALLLSRYAHTEVMVIDDGSTDGTLAALQAAFDLVPIDLIPRASLSSAPIRRVFGSRSEPRLTVIEKENGGKADALNAGLRYAWTPLVCSLDADTLLDRGALSRLVWEFEAAPDTMAAGGIVRVVNGCQVQDGRVIDVRLPRGLLPRLQVLEYLRAFLGGRIAWSRLGMLLVISGAFGLFRRDAVIDAGGYDPSTVGEDAELVVRLHRRRRELGLPCRIIFFPDPICWTEVPSDAAVLRRQRDRWQRGLIEMLVRHRDMIGRPRYGGVGMLAMPFFVVFEALGPIIEVGGYLFVIMSALLGRIDWPFATAFVMVALAFGAALSFVALLIEEQAFQRYPSWRDLLSLLGLSVIDSLGYRQWMSLVRCRAWWTYFRRSGGWGEMTRAGFDVPG